MDRLFALALVLAVALTGTALSGCTADLPESTASLRGVVTSVAAGADDRVSLRVVWDGAAGPKYEYDAADVTLTSDTRIFRTESGRREDAMNAAARDIEVRDLVEVWISGPVAESYPVQAGASDVLVFGTLATSRPLPFPPGLLPPDESD